MQNIHTELLRQLEILDQEMYKVITLHESELQHLHPRNIVSAGNLIKYLFFRSKDQRPLQEILHDMGLSSLTSSESHMHRQLHEVMKRLGKNLEPDMLDRQAGTAILRNNATRVFGKRFSEDHPAIMVTYETAFANDPKVIAELIKAGMQVARINCAHDNEEVWEKMISHTRQQALLLGKDVKIYMDLAGPKIRTVINTKGKKNDRINLEEGEVLPLIERNPKGEQAIGCSLSGIVPVLNPGQKVYFDDGRIQASVLSNKNKEVLITIERISGKPRLKSEKGINFPDAHIPINGLTDYDFKCLSFIANNSDMLGFSFVRTPQDIIDLRNAFKSQGLKHIPFILKIETAEAVTNLPSLLLECMKDEFSGVMIARGDLALEISFERLTEIQEEIIWICEAAHIPVIWATQVLDSLNKSGLATRSEGTDAAMAAHVECVMLNKGKNIQKVLDSLKDILRRSSSHRSKKRYVFRALSIAENFHSMNLNKVSV